MRAPRASVIVLSWNGRELLAGCLESLARQTCSEFETLVLDNGSSDGTVAALAPRFPFVRWLEEPANTGFCAGNNRAIAKARSDLIVLLNNDAEVAEDFVENLVRASDANPEIGMFATRIMLFDRREVFDSTGLLIYADGVCRSRGWLEKDLGQFDREEEVLGPNGCAAAYRRAMLEDVGTFDEDYFAYLEDLDLAMRGQLRGWRCLYLPDVVVWHKKSMTSGYHSAFKAYHVERNRIWNAIKLLPRRLLLLSPAFTLVRYLAQGAAAASGRGISSNFRRDYSHGQLVGILVRAYASALWRLPAMWRKRRDIQRGRRLGMMDVSRLLRRYRLPLEELAFKD